MLTDYRSLNNVVTYKLLNTVEKLFWHGELLVYKVLSMILKYILDEGFPH